MAKRVYDIKNKDQAERLAKAILDKEGAFTVHVYDKIIKPRTSKQNRLQRLWVNEAAEQRPQHSAEEYRAMCKLFYGVPIMREDEYFDQRYREVVLGASYEGKLWLMSEPIDFPVTRLMTTEQKKRYLDAMYVGLTELGVRLTNPNEYK